MRDALRQEQIEKSLNTILENTIKKETREKANRLRAEILNKGLNPVTEAQANELIDTYVQEKTTRNQEPSQTIHVQSGNQEVQQVQRPPQVHARAGGDEGAYTKVAVGSNHYHEDVQNSRYDYETMTPTDVAFDVVREALEGGYYHPDLHGSDGNSGETYFGIDRRWRGEGKYAELFDQFWKIIDDYKKNLLLKKGSGRVTGNKTIPDIERNARFPADIDKQLQMLNNQMMAIRYQKLANTYLSDEQKDLINRYSQLKIHFVYAVWNGDAMFKDLTNILRKSIRSGGNEKEIVDRAHLAIHNHRMHKNSWYAITGAKLAILVPPPGVDVNALSNTYLKGKFSQNPIQAIHDIAENTGRNSHHRSDTALF